MNLEKYKNIVHRHLVTEFEKNLCNSTFQSLNDTLNDMRFNNFSNGLRELSRHVLKRIAPDGRVLKCEWYKNKNPSKPNSITRSQRIKYAVQGGLSNNFVINKLGIDISSLTKKWSAALKIFNKHVHVNESSFNISDKKIEKYVKEGAECFENLFTTIEECRNKLINKLECLINRKLVEKIYENHFEELDILSTHYQYDYFSIDEIKVKNLNEEKVDFNVSGTINIIQQFGSSSDIKKGDGMILEKSISYQSTFTEKIENFSNANPRITNFELDLDEDFEYQESF